MKHSVYIVRLALLLLVFGTLTGIDCNGEPELYSIQGDYEGTYHVLSTQGTDTLVDTTNVVTVRFTNATYVIKVSSEPETQFFCSSSGDYVIENGIVFVEEESDLDSAGCDTLYNVRGFFGLDESTYPGKLLIKQDLTDPPGVRTIKTLLLGKVTN